RGGRPRRRHRRHPRAAGSWLHVLARLRRSRRPRLRAAVDEPGRHVRMNREKVMLRNIPAILALLMLAAPALANAGRRVEVNGMQMYYEASGAGEPLIVLHGAYMNIPSMGAIIPRLAGHYRVYALELQGHGRRSDIARRSAYP